MVSWTYATPNEALGFFDCIFRDQEVGGSNPLAPTTFNQRFTASEEVKEHLAESARGITPRAAHRSGHEPLDSSGSCHPKKAAAFRQDSEFLRLPVDSILTWMTCSLRSADITPLPRYYEAVRPWPVHRYFRPCGFSTLGLIP